MLCTFTAMAMVGKVLRLGRLEEPFGVLYPVHKQEIVAYESCRESIAMGKLKLSAVGSMPLFTSF
jgi:hypothetical protein